MADLSHWVAQTCEYHDSEGTFKVIYFQDRQELITVGEELLRNEDSWRDDLFSSNMGSSVYKNQVTMRSPDTGSPEPCEVPAGSNDLLLFLTCGLFNTLPSSSTVPKSDIPKASMEKLLYHEGPPSQTTIATSSSKNDVQDAKEKEKWMKYIKSIKRDGFVYHVFDWFKKDHRVYPSQADESQDEHQDEGSSSLPTPLSNHTDSLENNPYRHSKPPEYRNKYALVFGITTEFNPSGVWVIQELYNDMQESEF